jgi:type I restriction enzyme S subunit
MISLPCRLPEGWKLVPLPEICEINPAKPDGFARETDAPTTFIPMEAVDEKTGAVLTPQNRPYGAVARGYTYFEEGDVISAKITPCMQNGKTAIVTGLLDGIGFGSTEFHVLRANPGVDSRWIYYLLRTAEFRRKSEGNFEGSAGQRRVPEHFLKAVHVPVIEDADAQTRLMGALDTRIRHTQRMQPAAEHQLEASPALLIAELRRVFSVKVLPAGWTRKPICDLVRADGQQVDSRDVEFSVLPFLGLENIESGTGRFIVPEDQGEPGKSACFRFGAQHVLYGKLRPYLNRVFWFSSG